MDGINVAWVRHKVRGTSEWALKLSDLKCIMSQLVQLREALFVSVLRIL